MLGLVLRACIALGIREPMEFYDLSEGAQEVWIAHARNEFTGAYLSRGETKPGAKAPPDPRVSDFARRAIAAARERGAL